MTNCHFVCTGGEKGEGEEGDFILTKVDGKLKGVGTLINDEEETIDTSLVVSLIDWENETIKSVSFVMGIPFSTDCEYVFKFKDNPREAHIINSYFNFLPVEK